jgi:S-adenosylmethionine:tRNA ribosyltransferase-isomerase
MVLDRSSGAIEHRVMCDIVRYIESGALMVFNDSRVRKARIFGVARDGGSQVEFLLLRRLGEGRWEAVASKLNRQRRGRLYDLPGGVCAESLGSAEAEKALRPDSIYLAFSPDIDDAYLERYGHVPLPPYIRREDVPEDEERYQTVYARETGSAACPTAGLHFTEEILRSLDAAGVRRVMVTLHVGLGTFLPVRTERIEDHLMHEEEYELSEEAAREVASAKAERRPIYAVGTTSLRTLESAWSDECGLKAGRGATRIFIYPGYTFKVVDGLFTNFHTPRSTLLMLVSAFAGRERVLAAYAEAVRERYRFFSYGDAMLIRNMTSMASYAH